MTQNLHHKAEREDLAAALRWAARLGWQSGICNHFSLAVDGDDNGAPAGVLINPQGYHWSEVTASSLLLMDEEGDGYVEATAYYIHSAIHQRVPTVCCVMHAHPPQTTVIICTEGGRLLNCHQDCLRFYRRIAYDDDFGGVADHAEEGDRISNALGNRTIMMMAHHGITVTGPDVCHTLDDFYYLENAAKYQHIAQGSGVPLKVIDEETADRLAPAFQKQDEQMTGHFAAIKRILAKQEPEYLN